MGLNCALIYRYMLLLAGPIISGFAVFIILASLFVPFNIAGPISISMSFLIFGLAMNYSSNTQTFEKSRVTETEIRQARSLLNIAFFSVYLSSIVLAFYSRQDPAIFTHWEEITNTQVIRLAAAVFITLFAPGYAIVSIIDSKNHLRSLPKFLIAYLFSYLFSGSVGYAAGIQGLPIHYILSAFFVIHFF